MVKKKKKRVLCHVHFYFLFCENIAPPDIGGLVIFVVFCILCFVPGILYFCIFTVVAAFFLVSTLFLGGRTGSRRGYRCFSGPAPTRWRPSLRRSGSIPCSPSWATLLPSRRGRRWPTSAETGPLGWTPIWRSSARLRWCGGVQSYAEYVLLSRVAHAVLFCCVRDRFSVGLLSSIVFGYHSWYGGSCCVGIGSVRPNIYQVQ